MTRPFEQDKLTQIESASVTMPEGGSQIEKCMKAIHSDNVATESEKNDASAVCSPRVVALIPCYNPRRYIRETVESLLQQTRKVDLIVVMDDGSTDGFESEIQDLVETHDNLIIHHNPRNLGVSSTRNIGFERYAADFYILNDADDISLPDRVERTILFMQAHPNCGIVGGFVEYINSQGKVFGKGTQIDCITEEDSRRYRESMKPLGLFTPTVCLRGRMLRETGLRFDEKLSMSEDIDLWNRVLESGWDVLAIPDFLSQYRFHGNSVCTSRFVYCKKSFLFVKENLRRRRSGKNLLTYDEYEDSIRRLGSIARLKYMYPIYAEYLYRTGGYNVVDAHPLRGGIMLLGSFLMQPWRVWRIIRQRFGLRS